MDSYLQYTFYSLSVHFYTIHWFLYVFISSIRKFYPKICTRVPFVCFTSYLGLYKNDSFDLMLLDYILNYKIHSNTFITHFRKIITLLNQLLITKHIDEELIFSSTQTTPIWHSLYFQEWNTFSSKMDKIWFIQNSELNDHQWKSQRNQATPNPISSLIQIHLFPSSFHFSTNFI